MRLGLSLSPGLVSDSQIFCISPQIHRLTRMHMTPLWLASAAFLSFCFLFCPEMCVRTHAHVWGSMCVWGLTCLCMLVEAVDWHQVAFSVGGASSSLPRGSSFSSSWCLGSQIAHPPELYVNTKDLSFRSAQQTCHQLGHLPSPSLSFWRHWILTCIFYVFEIISYFVFLLIPYVGSSKYMRWKILDLKTCQFYYSFCLYVFIFYFHSCIFSF